MTPEQLYEIAFVVAAARTHATDAEYVKEIDPLITKLIEAVQEAWQERDEARAALQDIAEGDCEYGDNCPSNAGTRHGTCTPCKARQALEGTEAHR